MTTSLLITKIIVLLFTAATTTMMTHAQELYHKEGHYNQTDEQEHLLLMEQLEASCSYYDSCSTCLNTYTCNWCSFDKACHVKGSLYGCFSGESECPDDDDSSSADDGGGDVPDEPGDRTCHELTTCGECSNTYTCHWCEHDNSCHLKGSVYGCVAGVYCYDNDRCMRKEPEPVEVDIFPLPGSNEDVVITWPLVVGLLCFGMFSLSLATCVYCGVGVAKDMYDDFAILTKNARYQSQGTGMYASAFSVPKARNSKNRFSEMTDIINDERKRYINDNESDEELDSLSHDYDLLLSNADEVLSAEGSLPVDDNQAILTESRCASCRLRLLVGCCRMMYLIFMGTIVLLVVGIIAFYPQYPEYNICSDAMDWKSIVDGMTSMKVEATFQILISVKNPNKFDAILDMGSGSFSHDGVHVGTFEIPQGTTIKSMAITDILSTVTITPNKWQALELTSEYYKGTLSFVVDAEVDATIPALGGYTFQTKISNYMIHVGDAMDDRHLCACQSWSSEVQSNFLDESALIA
mmetsp:Transcript_15416/g.20087  ORF Transcript_15416/g.20087 Transcript_15416/m.20087 type:complete len:522 (-) Transcript_15416:47-1612(-)